MKRKEPARVLFLMALIVVGSFSPNCMAFTIDSLDGTLTDEIAGLVESGDIPSLYVCVVSGDRKWVKGFGEQTDEDTVFLVGSIQKVFVAVSILQLYEEGLVGLDDDVNMYLPFSIRHLEYPDTPITIRMLLSHRSGLDATLPSEFPYDWGDDNPPEWSRSFPEELVNLTLIEWLEMNLDEEGDLYSLSHWVREPGTGYSYSNNGYKILMCILECVTGQSIQEYMDENIFTPLQMDHSGFDSLAFIDEHAIPHTRKYGNDTNTPLPVWNGRYMLRSTASDMGNLMIALMNDGVYGDERILEEETIKLMATNTRSSIFLRDYVRKLKTDGYGMGIQVCNHGLLGHGGSTVGFTGEFYFSPSKNIGVFRISNVNAILDYTSEGWKDIGQTNDQILNSMMRKTGLLPIVDYIVLFPMVGSIMALFLNRRKIREQLNKRFNLGGEN
jgi:CubicO group peptidase (beta-lactamase class C family)